MAINLASILKGINASVPQGVQAAQIPGLEPAPDATAQSQAAPQQVSIYDDPAYKQYVLQSQTNQQIQLADAARRQAALQQVLSTQLPGLERDQAQQQSNLTNSSAARGIFHSGEYLKNASQLADQQGRQKASLVSETASGIGNLSSQLAGNIAQQQADQANQALKSQQNLNQATSGNW